MVEHTFSNWGNFNMRVYYIAPVITSNSSNSTNSTSADNFPTGGFDESAGGLIDIRDELLG